MQIEISGIKIKLRQLTRLEWLGLDLTYTDKETNEIHFLDPRKDYLELLARRVSFAVEEWGDQPGISIAEILLNHDYHGPAVAIAEYLDGTLPELPVLTAELKGKIIVVCGDDFEGEFEYVTIAEIRAIGAKYSDLPGPQRKAATIADILIDWDGHGRVTAEELLADRAKAHDYMLAVEVALNPFFRPPAISFNPSEPINHDHGDERGDDDSPVAIVA